jgi:hypothetical protein
MRLRSPAKQYRRRVLVHRYSSNDGDLKPSKSVGTCARVSPLAQARRGGKEVTSNE